MDKRGQFTFYRSFWEAVRELPKKDRLPIYEAVIEYALDGKDPVGLSKAQNAYFLLMKPTLDSARKKAANGKQGGSKRKANASKSQANGKQTEREKEKENENENEVEIEIEGEKEKEKKQTAPADGKLFTSFWEAYPSKIGRENAWEAWKQLSPDDTLAAQLMDSLKRWKASAQWLEDDGRYIPRAAKWLEEGYWKTSPSPAKQPIPKGASGELGEAELEAIQRILREEIT